jgi:hypothetical protein
VKKAVLSLALALVAAPSAFAAGGPALQQYVYGPFYVAEAYRAASFPHEEPIPCRTTPTWTARIAVNNRWSGAAPSGEPNTRAAAGVLSLAQTDDLVLDASRFATCPSGSDAFVQSFRLIKRIPGSDKCPNTYRKDTFYQFGSNVRTWWTLIYTQPGTTFSLELTVRCLDLLGRPTLHKDIYIWQVVATLESLLNVIDVLHSGAIGTTEIPCISSEDVYRSLVGAVEAIHDNLEPRNAAQDALFEAEAILLSFCCFTDCFIPEDVFSASYPPGNAMQFGDYGFTGVIDTIENPCCCKILVDLEYIGKCYDIVST